MLTDAPDDLLAAVAPEKIWTVKDKVSLKQIEEADNAQVITIEGLFQRCTAHLGYLE